MTDLRKRRFSKRASVRDTEFQPFEPSKTFPWPFLAVILALAVWGGFTLYMDARRADSEVLGRMQQPIALRQAPEAEPGDAAGEARALSGAELFSDYCATCHQANGSGVRGSVPPLQGSRFVAADPEVPITIVLRGLSGPIEVRGHVYTGRMPTFANTLGDEEVASILSYVRQSWQNGAGLVTAEMVAAIRAGLNAGPVQPLAGEAELVSLFDIPPAEQAKDKTGGQE